MLPTLSSLPSFAPGTVPGIAASVLPAVGNEPAIVVGLPEIGGLHALPGDQPAAPDAPATTSAIALPVRFSAALASAIDLAAPVISAPALVEAAPAPGNSSPPAGNELPVTRRAVTLFALPLLAGETVEAAKPARLTSDAPQDAREDEPDQPAPTLPGLFAVVAPIQRPRDLPAPVVAASSPAPAAPTAPATAATSSATKAAEPIRATPRLAAPVLPAGIELAPADPAPQPIAAEAVVRIAAPAAANLARPLAVKGTRSVETTVVAPAPTRADPIEPFTFRAQPEAAWPDAVQQPMPAPSFGLPDPGAPASPAITAAAPARPTDFATLVEAISRARDEVAPRMVAVSLAHADFGRVSLRFRDDGDALSVSMSSADPGFARAVHAAPAPEPLPAVAPKDAAPQDTAARRDGSPASGGQPGNGSAGQHGNAPASRQPARASSAQRGGDTAKADQSDIFA